MLARQLGVSAAPLLLLLLQPFGIAFCAELGRRHKPQALARSEHSPRSGRVARRGEPHVAVHMLDSGAVKIIHDSATPTDDLQKLAALQSKLEEKEKEVENARKKYDQASGRGIDNEQSSGLSVKKVDSKHVIKDDADDSSSDPDEVHDGFQERDDWRDTDRGYEWRHDHDSRDQDNDDDWDDEETRGTGEDSIRNNASDPDDTTLEGDGDEAFDNADVPIVNVTAEEDATTPADKGPLKAAKPKTPQAPPPENDVEKLGEGIGATAYERSPTGSRDINHELRKRLQLQDIATVALLIAVFGLTVLLSCCSVYQVAEDPSPAAYYSEPKHYQQRVICESNDVDAFLAAFNTQPQNVRLRIIGRNPEPGGFRRFLRSMNAHAARPRGLAALLPVRQRRRLPVLFDVALDLSPFITGDGRLSDDNLATLQKYLNTKNGLETLLIQKRVDWILWEDVATNIKQRLRTLGFPGDVDVLFEAQDEVLIYQNHKWSNFIRNRVTQALVVISVVGSAVWLPYVWVRSKTTRVETRFRINVDESRYWELVSEGLSAASGFQTT